MTRAAELCVACLQSIARTSSEGPVLEAALASVRTVCKGLLAVIKAVAGKVSDFADNKELSTLMRCKTGIFFLVQQAITQNSDYAKGFKKMSEYEVAWLRLSDKVTKAQEGLQAGSCNVDVVVDVMKDLPTWQDSLEPGPLF